MAMRSFSCSISLESYGGSTSWLKQVWAWGSILVWPLQQEILKGISPIPPTGILSLPVVKSSSCFCWATDISSRICQNHLRGREGLVIGVIQVVCWKTVLPPSSLGGEAIRNGSSIRGNATSTIEPIAMVHQCTRSILLVHLENGITSDWNTVSNWFKFQSMVIAI